MAPRRPPVAARRSAPIANETMENAETMQVLDYFYVARQPIFNNAGDIWGYELLFRSALGKTSAEIVDQDLATLCVATCGFAQAQGHCDPTKNICINFTEKLILEGAPRALPPTATVIEVPETIDPSQRLIETLNQMRQEGYTIAVNGSTGGDTPNALLDIADIIKVNLLGKTEADIENLFHDLAHHSALKAAQKVDNRDTFQLVRSLNVDLYQGYFFAKPVNLHGRQPKSAEVSKLRILQAIENPQADAESIKCAIETDPGITYRLLRLLNSAAFGFSVKIESVKHAIHLMGLKRLRYWLRMAVMSDVSKGPFGTELLVMGLNRGRFLEELAQQEAIASVEPDTLFLFGLLSLIEPMLELPITSVLSELPLSDEIKAGYLDGNSTCGKYLQLAAAIENGDIKTIVTLCDQMGIDKTRAAEASKQSLAWANSMFHSMT